MVDRIDKHTLEDHDDAFGMMDTSDTLGQPPRDPWQGRSEHMKCISCMAYAPKTFFVGRCRNNSPTMQGYPVVFPNDDWCRAHKIDEVYIGNQKSREEADNVARLIKGTIER